MIEPSSVIAIIEGHTRIRPVTPESTLAALDIDSLETIPIVFELEEALCVDISAGSENRWYFVRDIIAYLQEQEDAGVEIF